MGISQIGVSAATVSPINSNRPIFTYNNAYTNTYASHTLNRADATYNPNDTKIMWAFDNWTGGTNWLKFDINTNTFSTGTTLPLSSQEKYQLTCISDGTLGYLPDADTASSLTWYRSTDNGATWTSITSQTNINCQFPISSTLRTPSNNSDVVPFGLIFSTSDIRYWNKTANTLYAGTLSTDVGYTGNTAGTTLYKKVLPIRKGDDVFDFSGYYFINGVGTNGSGPSGGTRHVMYVGGEDKRNSLFFGHMPAIEMEAGTTGNTATYANVMFYNPQGHGTCIENRWFLFNSNIGFYLYDFLNKTMVQTPIPEAGRGYYTTRPIYISSTKKLYIYNSSAKAMRVWDVSFE